MIPEISDQSAASSLTVEQSETSSLTIDQLATLIPDHLTNQQLSSLPNQQLTSLTTGPISNSHT
jgi:hypothetical protein